MNAVATLITTSLSNNRTPVVPHPKDLNGQPQPKSTTIVPVVCTIRLMCPTTSLLPQPQYEVFDAFIAAVQYVVRSVQNINESAVGLNAQPAFSITTRDENEPEMQPKSVVETVATKPDADNPKISMDVQVLPPPTGQMG